MKIESLQFKKLSFWYDEKNPVFKDADFEFPMNSVVWVKGNFGSGKTTFLKLLSGILEPNSGTILVNNQDIFSLGPIKYSKFQKEIGFGFDGTGLFANQSLLQNLAIPLRYHLNLEQSEIDSWVMKWADYFKITKYMNERPAFVSQGAYKITLLLRAFITKPSMVVLNNPLTGLDEEQSELFIKMVKEFQQEHGLKHIFFISDEANILNQLKPIKLEMSNGKIAFEEIRKVA